MVMGELFMSQSMLSPFGGLKRLYSVLLVGTLIVSVSSTLKAEPAADSLSLVPQDAACYSAMLRNREQVELVANSNFWQRLIEWEVTQQAVMGFNMQMRRSGGELQQILQLLEQPENQQAVELIKEMVSTEMFCYGNKQMVGTASLAAEAIGVLRYGSMMYQLTGRDSGLSRDEFMQKLILDLLAEDVENVAIPGVVFGFKIENVDVANEQLNRIEAMIRVIFEETPELAPIAGGFRRAKIGGGDYLVLTVPGTLVPWYPATLVPWYPGTLGRDSV